jgi:hypothetical protein
MGEHQTEEHNSVASVRVHNKSKYPMYSCWAYIAFDDIRNEDIIEDRHLPTRDRVHFHRDGFLRLTEDSEDRLHWAYKFSASMDILPGEMQALRVFRVCRLPMENWIGVFSEDGDWIDNKANARIFLTTGRAYAGYIKIVSEDMPAKKFRFKIDQPPDPKYPIRIVGPGSGL